jgi:hypothetical protein
MAEESCAAEILIIIRTDNICSSFIVIISIVIVIKNLIELYGAGVA